jgi:hypothetical protein
MDPEGIAWRTPHAYVCDVHTDDYAVAEFIRENAEETHCDYCARTGENDGLHWPHFDALKWPHLSRLLVSG